jgi:hypothetical protein
LANFAGQYLDCKESLRNQRLRMQKETIATPSRHLLPLDRLYRREEDNPND